MCRPAWDIDFAFLKLFIETDWATMTYRLIGRSTRYEDAVDIVGAGISGDRLYATATRMAVLSKGKRTYFASHAFLETGLETMILHCMYSYEVCIKYA